MSDLRFVRYLAGMSLGRYILWCYFIWYLLVLVRYFDPNPWLWLTSLGVSVIIGVALFINTTASGSSRIRLEAWPMFRLFLTPFCVSSFAALVKGQGFIVIFSPRLWETLAGLGGCAVLAVAVMAARRIRRAAVEVEKDRPFPQATRLQ